jgi:hypothetical protein
MANATIPLEMACTKSNHIDRVFDDEIVCFDLQSHLESYKLTVLVLIINHRQAQTPTMAIRSSQVPVTPDTMGNPVSCLDAG